MNWSLTNHSQEYRLSASEFCWAAIGFTGAPYALRHLEQSHRAGSSLMAHRAIFLIECMPIVGVFAACIEKIVHARLNSSSSRPEEEATAPAPALSTEELASLDPEPAPAPAHPSEEPASPDPATAPAPAPHGEESPASAAEAEEYVTPPPLPEEPPPLPTEEPPAKNPIQRMYRNLEKSVREHNVSHIKERAFRRGYLARGDIKERYGDQYDSDEQMLLRQCIGMEKFILDQIAELQTIASKDSPYIQPSQLPICPIDITKKEPIPLKLAAKITAKKGGRERGEDCNLYKKFEKGVLAGIFDGNGGKGVAEFASKQFPKKFPDALERAEGNVHQAFEATIDQIHAEVTSHPEWDDMGNTAVICYIDNETHMVYTATLGPCEANIYRKFGEKMKSIPLSPQRNWLSSRDRTRLKAVLPEALDLDKYFQKLKAAQIRLLVENNRSDFILSKAVRTRLSEGINAARAIGHVAENKLHPTPLILRKSKITVFKLQPEDTLTLSSKGLKNYLSEEDIIFILSSDKTKNPSSFLVQAAKKNMSRKSNDNVTVGVIKVSLDSKK